MKSVATNQMSKASLSLLYALIVMSYCWLYAPYGLENNDGGFILGLSYQFSQGASLYEDIIYIRPPVSIIIHAVHFLHPFELAPVLSSRVIFLTQIAIYSALAGVLLGRLFNFSELGVFLVSAASFMFNTHNFPPMAWHTVDGIFFSVLAIYFSAARFNNATFARGLVAFAFAYAAALSKQPYYLTPLLVALILAYPLSLHRLALTISSAIAAAAIAFVFLASILDVTRMLEAMSSQTSLRDLVSAGIVDFARDWHNLRTAVTAGPLAAALLFWAYNRFRGTQVSRIRYLPAIFGAAVVIYLASMLLMFLKTDRWVGPGSLIDAVFTITATIAAIEAIRTRDRAWLVLTAMHVISWAASISWGYTTVALFSAPSLIVIAIALRDAFEGNRWAPVGSVMAMVVIAITFYVGNQFLYSLEGPVRRQEASVSMGDKFPRLWGVFATEKNLAAYRELAELTSRLGNDLIVAPNWPLYNSVFGGDNPIGVDWLLNAEIGAYEDRVLERIDRVRYVLFFRNAKPNPQSEGRFGSRPTQRVMSSWLMQEVGSQYFDVYLNPYYAAD